MKDKALMATPARQHEAQSGLTAAGSAGLWLPAASLWWREIVRFYRNRGRVAGVILSPLLFWLVIGSGFGTSFRAAGPAAEAHYLEYFFPGALTMIVLFTSIFAMMSVIEDRKEGFLLSVLVAPVNRSVIVLGKVVGGASLATIQGMIFLIFTPLLHGAHVGLDNIGPIFVTVFLISFSLTALGFAIAWPMDSPQAFHAIVNLFLIPFWLISGALFPLSGASGWLRILMRCNPLTYGNEALRQLLFPDAASVLPLGSSLLVLATLFGCDICVGLRRGQPAQPQARCRNSGSPILRRNFGSSASIITGNAMTYSALPAVNATLNALSAVLVLTGLV